MVWLDSSQGLQRLAHVMILYHKDVGAIITTFYGFVIKIEGELGGLGCTNAAHSQDFQGWPLTSSWGITFEPLGYLAC